MKVRIRFSKYGEMRYIGHLDMMRCFQKAIRRAGFDIAYSQGFNPHQILSFASPLSLGMESEGEYFDAEFNSCLSSEKMILEFNRQLTDEIRVTSFRILPENEKTNAMASLRACLYRVDFMAELTECIDLAGGLENAWHDFILQDEIFVLHKTKTKEQVSDIRPLIISGAADGSSLELMLRAGSEKSIKPVAVMDAFMSWIKAGHSGQEAFLTGLIAITRLDQFTFKDDKYISLGEMGDINE